MVKVKHRGDLEKIKVQRRKHDKGLKDSFVYFEYFLNPPLSKFPFSENAIQMPEIQHLDR